MSQTKTPYGNMTNMCEENPLRYTLFGDHRATSMRIKRGTFTTLCNRLEKINSCEKSSAPMIKLAVFNGKTTSGGCLRSDATLEEVTGIEGDYDEGIIEPEQAILMLQDIGIIAVIVTTHSHTPDRPRWRVFAPLSSPVSPSDRQRFVDGLNGALGGILAPESWTLSQAYYIGRPISGEYKILTTSNDGKNGSLYLDQWNDLDKKAIGKRTKNSRTKNLPSHTGTRGKKGREQLLEELLSGNDVHGNAMRLIGSWIAMGLDDAMIRLNIESIAPYVAQERGKNRAACLMGAELDRLINGAKAKGFGPKPPLPLPGGL